MEIVFFYSETCTNPQRARDVFAEMVEGGKSAAEVIKERGFEKVDDSQLEQLCQQLLADNPKIVEDVQGGKQQAVGALIGQAKKLNPNINPGQIRSICLELIKSMG